jgi:hypothetical protein
MLTEKAIKDTAHCPVLWKEEAGNPKRLKSDRKYQDETIFFIKEALSTGKSNTKVVFSSGWNSREATPYSGDFWIVVKSDEVDLLIIVSEVILTKDDKNPYHLTVRRRKSYQSSDEDQIFSERMIRRVLFRAFKEVFQKVEISIETRYKGDPQGYVTQNPGEDLLEEADRYFSRINEMAIGERPLVVNLEKCPSCWWKECPYRVEGRKPSTGKPQTIVLK